MRLRRQSQMPPGSQRGPFPADRCWDHPTQPLSDSLNSPSAPSYRPHGRLPEDGSLRLRPAGGISSPCSRERSSSTISVEIRRSGPILPLTPPSWLSSSENDSRVWSRPPSDEQDLAARSSTAPDTARHPPTGTLSWSYHRTTGSSGVAFATAGTRPPGSRKRPFRMDGSGR